MSHEGTSGAGSSSSPRLSVDIKQLAATAAEKGRTLLPMNRGGGGGSGGGSANSIFTLIINDQPVQIRSIRICVDNAATASVEVKAAAAAAPGGTEPSLATACSAADATETYGGEGGGKAKKKSFFQKLVKKPSNAGKMTATAAAAAAAASGNAAAGTSAGTDDGDGEAAATAAAAANGSSSGGFDGAQAAPTMAASAAAVAAALRQEKKKKDRLQKLDSTKPGKGQMISSGGGESSSNSEVDMSAEAGRGVQPFPRAAVVVSARDGFNTADSEISVGDGPTAGASSGSKVAGAKGKFRIKFKKNKGSRDPLNFSFPQDVPENAKTLFQLTPETRLLATVYTSAAGRTSAVKKQKALLTEGSEKRFTVDGKARSVWLDPPAGEAVEIWKEYFGDDGECNRALGRLPDTDKYGFILPDEIDQDKEFGNSEEQKKARVAYIQSLQDLAMFQNEYGNEVAEDEDEEQYM